MRAVIIGATGAIGREIYKNIIIDNDYKEVIVLGRKSIFNLEKNNKSKLIEIDFENINFDLDLLNYADVFCAFGTTLKQAKSKENQYKVDYTYIMNFAKICENRVKSFNLVSSLGANPNSKNFYTYVKGKLEQDISSLSLGKLRIIRPSLLIAKRENKRFFEDLAIKLVPLIKLLTNGKLSKYTPVEVEKVAKSMIYFAKNNEKLAIYTHENFI